jgi:hypothetical protein
MTDTAATTSPIDHPEHWRTVRQFAYVDRAFRDVRRYLAADPARIIGRGQPDAGSVHDGALTELHVRRAGFDLVRDVRMVMGDLQVGIHNARLPLRWEDATRPQLFPLLDATFELVQVSAGRRPMTQLGLVGRYQPPLGRLGSLADTLAGHRIVLESVERFLDELAARLERDVAASPPDFTNSDSAPPRGRRRVILPVDDLERRPGGAAGAQLLLEGISGVFEASVNPISELAVIDYDAQSCSAQRLQQALEGPQVS